MSDLSKDIAYYQSNKDEFESKYTGNWVLVSDQKLISVHVNFEQAAEEAVRLFGAGPYLIRQVGAPPIVLPVSVTHLIGRDG